MSDLSKVKKGDPVAVVSGGGHMRPTTAEKALVIKKNPTSLVIEHKGKEVRITLDGRGLGYSEWVEPWDDAAELERLEEGKRFMARQELVEVGQLFSILGRKMLTPNDVIREPEKFAEIKRLRAEVLEKTEALCAEILGSRPAGKV